jgi:hypothetical protein
MKATSWWQMPPVYDAQSAYAAAQRSANAAFTIAALTVLAVILNLVFPNLLGSLVDLSSLVDAAIFIFLGWRVRRNASFPAAAALLLFYVAERIYLLTQLEKTSGGAFWLYSIMFTLQFFYGATGARAHRRYLKQAALSTPAPIE